MPKTIANRKDIVREVARGDILEKSADRKGQISKALVQLTGLIRASRSADPLKECLYHLEQPHALRQRHNLLPYFY